MIRTSITLPESLHHRLMLTAKAEGKSFAALARDLLGKVLVTKEEEELEHIYREMDKIKGIGSPDVTDGSTTINETLYGEHGAWRGSE